MQRDAGSVDEGSPELLGELGVEGPDPLGLVLKVVPRDRLMEEALALAASIAGGPPLGMAASKHVVYMAGDHDLEQADTFVSLSVSGLFQTDDAAEGVRSFRERREPEFTGR